MSEKASHDNKEPNLLPCGQPQLKSKYRKLVVLAVLVLICMQAIASAYYMMEKKSGGEADAPTRDFVIQQTAPIREHSGLRPKHHAVIPTVRQPAPDHSGNLFTPEIKSNPDSMLIINEEHYTPPFFSDDKRVILWSPSKETPISREPETRSSLRKELLRPQDLDYGRHKGIIFEEPVRKQNIEGFIKIPIVWGTQLKPPDALKRSVIGLAEAMNRYTRIRADIDPHLFLDSQHMKEIPFIYITTDHAFELSAVERKNFGDYLRNGGFAVLDNGTPEYDYGQAEASLRQMLRDSLGAHARFLPIPNNHPFYHCFFDFDDGPPQGGEVQPFTTDTHNIGYAGERRTFMMSRQVHYIEGIWYENRLIAIYSNKGCGLKWGKFWTIPSKDVKANNVPQLKMGVNMVVFALTQEGGIAARTSKLFSYN